MDDVFYFFKMSGDGFQFGKIIRVVERTYLYEGGGPVKQAAAFTPQGLGQCEVTWCLPLPCGPARDL